MCSHNTLCFNFLSIEETMRKNVEAENVHERVAYNHERV